VELETRLSLTCPCSPFRGFKLKRGFALSLIVIIIVATAALLFTYPMGANKKETSGFRVGVTFCGNTTAQAKLLVDRVKSYTNLFVVQSGPVSVNETSMSEIVDYAVSTGLDVIVYFGWFNPAHPWQVPWLDFAKQRWGDKLLGIYLNDEPGGIQLDGNWTGFFKSVKLRNATQYLAHAPDFDRFLNGSLPRDYGEAAAHFTQYIETGTGLEELKKRSITSFTSDYALHWFNYLGGYDVVFAQFGWNQSITQGIALARGAATAQNKTWGVIVTWKYTVPPYLDSGEEIYQQLLAAYSAGAKYAVIFNYPQISGNEYGIISNEHFEALERFWNDITEPNTKTTDIENEAVAVLVLPRNYGWGMRNPDDIIWGFWGPDEKSAQIWEISRKLLSQYGSRLDIAYDDPEFPIAGEYSQIYYWNQTT